MNGFSNLKYRINGDFRKNYNQMGVKKKKIKNHLTTGFNVV